jgi:hypothetical protein
VHSDELRCDNSCCHVICPHYLSSLHYDYALDRASHIPLALHSAGNQWSELVATSSVWSTPASFTPATSDWLVDMRGRIEPLVQSDYPLQPNHLQHYWLLTCLRTFQTHHHCPACCLGDVLQHPPTGLHALWTLLHCSLTCPIPRCLFPGSSLLRRPPMHCNTSRSQRTRRRCAPMPTSSRCKARSVQSWTASR